MGSGYFGEPNLGNNERGGSSRKGKKSNSDKPKQPQRGLGVAQLEKIRLHGQMASDYHPSLHSPTTFNQQEDIRVQTGYSPTAASSASFGYPNFMMGLGDYDRTNIRYGGDFQHSTAARTRRKNTARNTEVARWALAVKILNQEIHKNWIWSSDCQYNEPFSANQMEGISFHALNCQLEVNDDWLCFGKLHTS
ncbi:hypothetical protein POTOM_025700 [Populus tomentosa]|uniref:Uncharacterized protein n=1 Tax=Populus tomentosa TaxID=118781 RepID=A0A8X7ZEK5_POPTO|nr:hypothetical protein POTOM_025700 [Populus tomentosa]